VLAAGVLLLSGWDGQGDFLDPMCGSGTFLAEAAMIACNIPQTLTVKICIRKMARLGQ
jgi:putative N6-adenine-specific DNA methylase